MAPKKKDHSFRVRTAVAQGDDDKWYGVAMVDTKQFISKPFDTELEAKVFVEGPLRDSLKAMAERLKKQGLTVTDNNKKS